MVTHSMDRKAWLVTVHGVAKSQTELSHQAWAHTHTHTHTPTHTHFQRQEIGKGEKNGSKKRKGLSLHYKWKPDFLILKGDWKKNAVKLLEDKEIGTSLHNLSKRNLDILSTGFVLGCEKTPLRTHAHEMAGRMERRNQCNQLLKCEFISNEVYWSYWINYINDNDRFERSARLGRATCY